MASRNNETRDDEIPSPPQSKATIQDRIAAFAMMDAMGKDATQAEKTVRLSLVGFGAADIAAMLQTSTQVVYQNLYEARKKAGARKAKQPKAAKAE